MTLPDLKGTLTVRAQRIADALKQSRARRILLESDLQTARVEEAEMQGSLTATQQALLDLDQPFLTPAQPAKPPQGA